MIDPITQHILNEGIFKKKSSTSRKGEELYYGFEFSVKEFKTLIGGNAKFKNVS